MTWSTVHPGCCGGVNLASGGARFRPTEAGLQALSRLVAVLGCWLCSQVSPRGGSSKQLGVHARTTWYRLGVRDGNAAMQMA